MMTYLAPKSKKQKSSYLMKVFVRRERIIGTKRQTMCYILLKVKGFSL